MSSGHIHFDLLPALWHSGTTTNSGLFHFPTAKIPAEKQELCGPETCSCHSINQNIIILKRLTCTILCAHLLRKIIKDGDSQCVAVSQVYQFQRSKSSDFQT